MFGCNLGTSDYGHITTEHASMLFRNHLSLREYSNQGFEAAHWLQRQLHVYSKATSHEQACSCYSKPAYKNTHFQVSGWLGSYISGILGVISLKVFLSVLNFLLLKKCKGFTNYDEMVMWLTLWQMATFISLHIFHVIIRLLIPNTVVVHLLYTASEITSIYTEILVQYHSKATDTVLLNWKGKSFYI